MMDLLYCTRAASAKRIFSPPEWADDPLEDATCKQSDALDLLLAGDKGDGSNTYEECEVKQV